METLDMLSMRTTDFVATIDIDDGNFLSRLARCTNGMACVAKLNKNRFEDLKNVRFVPRLKDLEDSVFSKVLARYHYKLNLRHLVRITEPLGLVLIQGVPKEKCDKLSQLLYDKSGIDEIWQLPGCYANSTDLLFKVRKHTKHEHIIHWG